MSLLTTLEDKEVGNVKLNYFSLSSDLVGNSLILINLS